MSAVTDKVITLHQLNLPYEMIETINSYCFYDYAQVRFNELLRTLKSDIIRKIENSMKGYEEDGQWWFMADVFENYTNDTNNERQFNGANCIICGNYYNANNYTIIPYNSKCHCFTNEHS
jgi:hypothetical protein